jgi:hypothetical protein
LRILTSAAQESSMAEARLEVEIGSLKFVGEGSEKWVEQQWEKVLLHASSTAIPPSKTHKPHVISDSPATNKQQTSLAIFLKEKATGTNQIKRFLATAVWLLHSGSKSIKTSDVSKALIDAHQKKLGNAADALNKNVTKGFCVKHEDGFYVTPEGEESLA